MRAGTRSAGGLAVALAGLLVSAAPALAATAAARVVDVRVDPRPAFTRIEFELDAPAPYRVEHRGPAAGRPHAEVVVHLGARGAYPMLAAIAEMRLQAARGHGLVEAVQLEEGDGRGGRARIRLATDHPQVRHTILRDPMRIAVDVRRAPREVERAALAPPRRIREAPAERKRRTELTEDPEEVRPREPLAAQVLGRPLVVAGEIEVRAGFDGNPRLGRRDDDRARLTWLLALELYYAATENLSFFAESEYRFDRDLFREGGGRSKATSFERGETWMHLARVGGTPLAFQIGRQKMRDEREWWWDEKLDSVRLLWSGERLEAQLAVGQELGPEALGGDPLDPEQEDVLRLFASAGWHYARSHRLDLFLLGQRDRSAREHLGRLVPADREDEVDADLTWAGLRATGRFAMGRAGFLRYWGDGGFVWGREHRADFDDGPRGQLLVDAAAVRRVRGWGLDVGASWETRLPGRPVLSLGYAVGSGDRDPGDGRDGGFRQTGLHDNETELGGVGRVRYYGELFDPELSNLQVATLAIGVPFLEASGFTLLYHLYRQVHARDSLREAGIRTAPLGEDPDLGQGLDAVLTLREWDPFRIEALASAFRAGRAYGEEAGVLAWGAGLKVELGF